METTSAVITIAKLLMLVSSGSGKPKPSVDLFHRPVPLQLHTGPLVRSPQCYSSTQSGPLPIVQLSPGNYLVLVEHEGDYWGEDSSGMHRNKYHWRKKRSTRTQAVFRRSHVRYSGRETEDSGQVEKDGATVSYSDAPNRTESTIFLTESNTSTRKQDVAGRSNVSYSGGQTEESSQVEMDVTTVNYSGALNRTEGKVFLTEYNTSTRKQDAVGRSNATYSGGQTEESSQVETDGTTVSYSGALNRTESTIFLTESNTSTGKQDVVGTSNVSYSGRETEDSGQVEMDANTVNYSGALNRTESTVFLTEYNTSTGKQVVVGTSNVSYSGRETEDSGQVEMDATTVNYSGALNRTESTVFLTEYNTSTGKQDVVGTSNVSYSGRETGDSGQVEMDATTVNYSGALNRTESTVFLTEYNTNTGKQVVVGTSNVSYSGRETEDPGQVEKYGTTVSYSDALNMTESTVFLTEYNTNTGKQDVVGTSNVSYSGGQMEESSQVEMDVTTVNYSGALNRTESTMFLSEYRPNITCPAQTQKGEDGVERYWPPIKLGSTYIYSSNNKCVEAARTCCWSREQGFHLATPDSLPPCTVTSVNLTQAAHGLWNISQKETISPADIEAAARIAGKALQVNDSILSTSREDVSSLLRGLEAILTRVRLSPGKNVTYIRPKVAIFVLNVQEQPPLAVALESNSSEDLEGSVLRTITSKEEILSPKVDVAVLLPQSLINYTSHVALAIFRDDSAFQDSAYKANSRIVSLNMADAPKLQGEQYVDIVFRPRTGKSSKTCAFWDFTLSGGAWSAEGCKLMASGGNTHDVCRCSHLTHFAEIISPPGMDVDPVHQDVLSIISIVGCSLSFIGLLAIFVTGAAFRHWRAQLGNKILLHLSTAVSINMLVFLIMATELLHTGLPCIILGVILHYSILASFCWMLVSAGLQFMRLVTIFGSQRIPHLLLKASIFAWGAPILPVAILLVVDVNNYTPQRRRFCYPEGLGFYLAVLCPVLMIVTANLFVFGMILHSILGGSAIKCHMRSERKLAMQRIATSVLLFFLLGLSWVFGLIAHLSILFAYLFCITSTLQGFVLFLFFVLGKKQSLFYRVRSSAK